MRPIRQSRKKRLLKEIINMVLLSLAWVDTIVDIRIRTEYSSQLNWSNLCGTVFLIDTHTDRAGIEIVIILW